MNGEWELEHDFMCSTCGQIFDELREVWHHKWDAHPRCLVMHVTLPRKGQKYLPPINLIHPQLGRQLEIGQGAAIKQGEIAQNMKKRRGRKPKQLASDNNAETATSLSNSSSSYHCKKCVNEKESGKMEGENINKFDTKEEFYVHLLECGGDNDWRGERNKKKKGSKGNRSHSSQPKGNSLHVVVSMRFCSLSFLAYLMYL